MGYYEQALLSGDQDFLNRIGACAAVEVDLADGQQPWEWATDHIWMVAAAPGFADKYSYALANGVPNPGKDQSVISDAEILAAIQALIAAP